MEAPAFEYLRLMRAASITLILAAAAVIACSIAYSAIKAARERERLRKIQADRIAREYRELFGRHK